jgi:hypothetical protein
MIPPTIPLQNSPRIERPKPDSGIGFDFTTFKVEK